MEIILAEHAGTCRGVKRSIKLAFDAVNHGNSHTYSLGPIIHNPQVVEKLEEKGVKVVDNVKSIDRGTVIIRTHGAPPLVKEALTKKSVKIVDATCPMVGKSQKIASQLVKEGYKVAIIGEREHPEVKGVVGFAKNNAIVVNTVEEANAMQKFIKLGVLAQTTITVEKFKDIISVLISKAKELRIFNTLCDETRKTQKFTSDLADEVDVMIIVGGKNSANTKHLVEICESKNVNTHHIEEKYELKKEWFKGKSKIGVSAGASTPDWIIEDVLKQLSIFKNGGK